MYLVDEAYVANLLSEGLFEIHLLYIRWNLLTLYRYEGIKLMMAMGG